MPSNEKLMLKAAKNGNVDAVKQLLALDPTLLGVRDTDGSTPLHCAAWKGQVDVVTCLLDAGADVNAQNENDHWGTTPLHAAAHANQAAIARALVEHGANVNAPDREGRTPLFHTSFHKAKAAAKVIEAHGGHTSQ